MIDNDGIHRRPTDERGFVHKRILGLAGTVARTVTSIPGVSLLPGAGIIETAGQVATRLSGRGRPAPVEVAGPSIIGVGNQRSRFPGGEIETQVAARKFAGTVPGGPSTNGCPPEAQVCAPRGFHLNKSSYFLRDGTFVPAGTKFVRNRRMNNANGRAQDRSIVRLEKGADHAKRLLKSTGWRTISKQSTKEIRNSKKAVCK